MRILSQDGNYDFPYDRVCLQVLDNGKIVAQGDIWNYANEENWIVAAEYGSCEKAKKAMEMLRTEYKNFQTTQTGAGFYFAFNYPKVFQFPDDEEIEA